MAQILTSYSDTEFKEILSEHVKEAVREALHGEKAEKPTPPPQKIGYRTRAETRIMLGVAYSTMHYWEKAGILVPGVARTAGETHSAWIGGGNRSAWSFFGRCVYPGNGRTRTQLAQEKEETGGRKIKRNKQIKH